jgi:hypothetical protein
VVEADEDRLNYLRHVLKINPENEAAQRGYAALERKLAKKSERVNSIRAAAPKPSEQI